MTQKHGSQQCTAQPTLLIYHVNFSNSPCSPCWPDNPCRQLQTSHTDRNSNGSWGSAQCVSGYDTPVNQMEIPEYASQRAVVPVLPAKRGLGCNFFVSIATYFPNYWYYQCLFSNIIWYFIINHWNDWMTEWMFLNRPTIRLSRFQYFSCSTDPQESPLHLGYSFESIIQNDLGCNYYYF